VSTLVTFGALEQAAAINARVANTKIFFMCSSRSSRAFYGSRCDKRVEVMPLTSPQPEPKFIV
jgi:hypothetical protein